MIDKPTKITDAKVEADRQQVAEFLAKHKPTILPPGWAMSPIMAFKGVNLAGKIVKGAGQ